MLLTPPDSHSRLAHLRRSGYGFALFALLAVLLCLVALEMRSRSVKVSPVVVCVPDSSPSAMTNLWFSTSPDVSPEFTNGLSWAFGVLREAHISFDSTASSFGICIWVARNQQAEAKRLLTTHPEFPRHSRWFRQGRFADETP